MDKQIKGIKIITCPKCGRVRIVVNQGEREKRIRKVFKAQF